MNRYIYRANCDEGLSNTRLKNVIVLFISEMCRGAPKSTSHPQTMNSHSQTMTCTSITYGISHNTNVVCNRINVIEKIVFGVFQFCIVDILSIETFLVNKSNN